MSGMPHPREDAVRALERQVVMMIRRARRVTALRAQLVHPELPSAAYSMLTAVQVDGPQRAADLADQFSLDKGAVSRYVAQLEQLGLVTRSPDPLDGRASLIAITEYGNERLTEVDQIRRDWYEARLSDFSDDELVELEAVLARYNAALGDGTFGPGSGG